MKTDFKKRLQDCLDSKKFKSNREFYDSIARLRGIDEDEFDKKNKGNYGKVINGDPSRHFNYDDIPYIERLLDTTIAHLELGDESAPNVNTILSAAYNDSVEQVKELLETLRDDNEEECVLFGQDEYGNNLLDYIYKYREQNKELRVLKYIVDKGFLKFNTNLYYLDSQYFCLTNSMKYSHQLLEIICDVDDDELFKKLFLNNAKPIYRDPDLIKQNVGSFEEVLKTNNILNTILESVPNEIEGPNGKEKFVFYYEIVPLLIDYCLEHFDEYKNKLNKILRFAFNHNRTCLELLSCSKSNRLYAIYDEDINFNGKACGSIFEIESETTLEDAKESAELINKINDLYSEAQKLINHNNYSRKRVLSKDAYGFTKAKSNNEIEYAFLDILEKEGYQKAPRISDGYTKDYDLLSCIEGTPINERNYYLSCYTTEIVKELKELNNISKKYLDNGKVYCHGDFTPENILEAHGTITGFVDWDETYIGEEYDNFIDTFINMTDLTEANQSFDLLFEKLIEMINVYDPDDSFKKDFANKMLERVNYYINKLDPERFDYKRRYQKYGIAKIWIELYKDKIKKTIG